MALSRHHAALSRPRSVEEIVNEAKSFEFNTARGLQQWIRSGKMLLTEATICEREENIQMAYLYMYRHAELIIAKLPGHPEYTDPKFKSDLTQAKKAVRKNLMKLEQLNPRINQDYQRYVKAMERRHVERQQIQRQNEGSHQSQPQSVVSPDPYSIQNLDTPRDRQAAVGMALKELHRRQLGSQTGAQPHMSSTQNGSKSSIPSHRDNNGESGRQLSDSIREAAHHLNQYESPKANLGVSATRHSTAQYAYPAVPVRERIMDWRASIQPPIYSDTEKPPAVPSKTPLHNMVVPELPVTAPPIPRKESVDVIPPSLPTKTTLESTPITDPEPPSLRPLLLPSSLTSTFTSLASSNTSRNLETCGILAGTLLSTSSTLALTHLILPSQISTPNTCDTTAEGDAALFDYCDNEHLLVLGWIHTHPSQTCFLSSRDLHTSAGYQTMLPEAIAIVCAPRYDPSVGIFRLTDPPGLETILKCTSSGTFHPHPNVSGGLYTDANADDEGRRKGEWSGHVVVAEGYGLKVVDLREK